MKTQLEIQRGHDLLLAILLNEVPNLSPLTRQQLNLAAGVLCWVLHHDHNPAFAEMLQMTEQRLADAGYVLENRSNGRTSFFANE